MGSEVASVAGGAVGGAIGGSMVTRRTKSAADHAISGGTLQQDLGTINDLLLPYDELVRQGKINPTSAGFYSGLSGNQSYLGRLLQNYQNDVAAADPVAGAYRDSVVNSLNMGESGLPADVEQRITRNVRSSLASRGLEDSSIGAIQEAGALAGGAEQIRAERLGQVRDYFTSSTQSAIQQLFPQLSGLYQGELSRAVQRSQNAIGAAGLGVSVANSASS